MPSLPLNVGWIDEGGEYTSTKVHFPEIASDGSNYAALFGVGGSWDLLKASLATVSLLNFTNVTGSIKVDTDLAVKPSDKDAQREWVCRVIYQDNVEGTKYRYDIPGPIDTIFEAGTDEVDLANNVVFGAFKAVFEAQCRSPLGNAVTITRAYRTGRRG